MILYPFQENAAGVYSVAGFDEQSGAAAQELLVVPAGAAIPAEFRGGYIFAPGCETADARQLCPAETAAHDARAVWVSAQPAGGEVRGFLQAQLARWGTRLWVYAAPRAAVYPVPCPDGAGTALAPEELQALLARIRVYDSAALGCRYGVFRDAAGAARVVLYDTDETLRARLALLRKLGVRQVFGKFTV